MSSLLSQHSSLSDREAIVDCLYRFAEGLDEKNEETLASSLAPDAAIDLSQPSQVLGAESYDLKGRDTIVDKLRTGFFPLDIATNFSNVRVEMEQDMSGARLSCNVTGIHYKGGDGPVPERQSVMWIGNRYRAKFVKLDNDGWRMRELTVVCIWSHGDVSVLTQQ